MKVKCKKINVSQNLQKVVLWVRTPLPQTSTVYIFLDIEHWPQSLSYTKMTKMSLTIPD